ncbi:MAG: ArsR/SmtB family transcription factor [Spirochaetota bacterium]
MSIFKYTHNVRLWIMDIEKILKALADTNRLRIVNLLLVDELCVCDIEEVLRLSQSNVSRHLGKLAAVQIISSQKDAQWVFYKINTAFIKEHPELAKYLKRALKNDVYLKDVMKLRQLRSKHNVIVHKRCAIRK